MNASLITFPDILVLHFQASFNKHGVEHHIVTHGRTTFSRPSQLLTEKLLAAKAEFWKIEEAGIMRRSGSPWSPSLHIVPKQLGDWRPCGYYRRLNETSTDDRYTLFHIQDFNSHLAGARIFLKIDLVCGYHQIPMAPATPFGQWEFLRMPFGLKNAAQTFQRLMDGIFRGIDFVFVYLDDIVVASASESQHTEHLRCVFDLLVSNGLVINKSKCLFGVGELDYLVIW